MEKNLENRYLGGRPAGKKKTAKIEVSIEPEIKEAFMTSLKENGKNASVEICSWIREYLKSQSEEYRR